MNNTNNLHERLIEKLQTVYDPEFPMVDIYTLGLIYDVLPDEESKKIKILMTFTTPACPMAEFLQECVKNAILEIAPEYSIDIEITFDPMRSPSMMKDEDLKKMFEM